MTTDNDLSLDEQPAAAELLAEEHEEVDWKALFTDAPDARLRWAIAIIGGLLAVAGVGAVSPDSWYLPAWLVVVAALPVLTLIDAETRLLPTVIIKWTGLTALAVAAACAGTSGERWTEILIAAGLGVAAYVGYAVIWFFSPPNGFGFGDVRLAGLLGFALGLHGPVLVLVAVLMLSTAIGLVIFGVTALVQRVQGREVEPTLPFGPSMAAATVLAMLCPATYEALLLALYR